MVAGDNPGEALAAEAPRRGRERASRLESAAALGLTPGELAARGQPRVAEALDEHDGGAAELDALGGAEAARLGEGGHDLGTVVIGEYRWEST